MSPNEKLSQEEIDALLKGKSANDSAPISADSTPSLLTPEECDGVGEIGNISFGSAATALSILLAQRVEITTPEVQVLRVAEVQDDFPRPYVVVTVDYTAGLSGLNALAIEINDAKIIADLMMGGDGTNVEQELNELHLSAVSEAMNQMMGGAATAMSTMFQRPINISPPVVKFIDLASGDKPELGDVEWVVNTSFRLKIGQLVDSRIMQWVSVPFAKEILQLAQDAFEGANTSDKAPPTSTAQSHTPQTPPSDMGSTFHMETAQQPVQAAPSQPGGQPPSAGQPQPTAWNNPNQGGRNEVAASAAADASYAGQGSWGQPDPSWGYGPQANPRGEDRGRYEPQQPVIGRPQFQEFDVKDSGQAMPHNLSLLFDVQLTVTVELGRTKRPIREILELGPGSVVELDKLAGEPVDILVNNKRVAIGEVVVIDENFGVRVTDILSQADRVRTLQA